MKEEYDLVVAGGGPAGLGAAFVAAKIGLKTAIVERHPSLGGNWTNGYVLSILGIYTYSGKTKIVGGIADEVISKLQSFSGTKGKVGNFVPFRPDEMKLALEEMAEELGIDIFYGSILSSAYVNNKTIEYVEAKTKYSTYKIYAKMFVDATGDADLCELCNLRTMEGRENTGTHQEATIPFRIANVNQEKVIGYSKIHPDEIAVVLDEESKLSRIRILPKLVEKAKSEHNLYLPHANSEFLFNTSKDGEFVCNATHVNISDFKNAEEISKATKDAREQIVSSLKFFASSIEGFENSYLIDSAPSIGLRETRRAIGEYVLSKNDVINNARFEDAIVRCGHPIEVHDPDKGVYYIMLSNGNDSWYEIPYRAIVVKNIDNLFAVGRCLSAEFEAQASARVTGTAMGMGQAAAIAAKLAIESRVAAKEVDIKKLQENLIRNGAIL
ncbi:MAG: FAD-dependent oxidoreductase [Candidatus Micrarchaeia archaeon]